MTVNGRMELALAAVSGPLGGRGCCVVGEGGALADLPPTDAAGAHPASAIVAAAPTNARRDKMVFDHLASESFESFTCVFNPFLHVSQQR